MISWSGWACLVLLLAPALWMLFWMGLIEPWILEREYKRRMEMRREVRDERLRPRDR